MTAGETCLQLDGPASHRSLVDENENEGNDDRSDPRNSIVVGEDGLPQVTADQGRRHSQDDGDEDVHALLSRHDESGKRPDDESRDDVNDDISHDSLLLGLQNAALT
jgi:hypothetical protein